MNGHLFPDVNLFNFFSHFVAFFIYILNLTKRSLGNRFRVFGIDSTSPEVGIDDESIIQQDCYNTNAPLFEHIVYGE